MYAAIGASFTALLFGATLALAEMPLPGAEPLVTGTEGFDALDADESGTVSTEEAEALETLATVFEDYDQDSDGELTRTEYQTALNATLEEEESE